MHQSCADGLDDKADTIYLQYPKKRPLNRARIKTTDTNSEETRAKIVDRTASLRSARISKYGSKEAAAADHARLMAINRARPAAIARKAKDRERGIMQDEERVRAAAKSARRRDAVTTLSTVRFAGSADDALPRFLTDPDASNFFASLRVSLQLVRFFIGYAGPLGEGDVLDKEDDISGPGAHEHLPAD
ncbi:hypothetical protein T492DRAFT_1120592 [Pavlovales sp. CCMP2436]|nr:hypothetical protein T492DRAFT_1120592 [Pavlovales sp. CCMP2436]